MTRITPLLLAQVFLLPAVCLGGPLLETEDFKLSMDSYFRTDVVALKNTVGLDSSNKDDSTVYLGIDYNLGFTYESKNSAARAFLKLERNGPGDYDAPLFIHNTLINSGGRIERYRNEQLLPQVEEAWLDLPLVRNFGLKTGLYTYEVGYGFSLNGSFENFGMTLYRENEGALWRIYYCRPEVVYKNPLGPHIPQDQDQGYFYHHNASNFFGTDVKFGKEDNYLQPYAGALVDYTSSGKRDNFFSAPIKRDILGTYGVAWSLKQEKSFLKFEAASNFGKGQSESADFEDIYHTGYLVYIAGGHESGKLVSSLHFVLASGNKVTPDMALNEDTTLSSSKNRAFSSSSPFNDNISTTIAACNSEERPVVFMGSGCGLHTGIARPETLGASDFDNLLMPSLVFDYALTPKAKLGLYNYYIRSFARPVGTLDGEARYLSRELGYELDTTLDYKVNPHLTFSFLGGYFLPGKYYKERRDDINGSLFSPFLRGDGKADAAYQLELSMEITF
ncbi:MAG: hypothetical protein NTU54_04085 [Candidatus Omnitrophica bacterium]|nr:hypothetical protein [Candidatus Omnitrophota bacterium]